jgi:hypothetical protein
MSSNKIKLQPPLTDFWEGINVILTQIVRHETVETKSSRILLELRAWELRL